MTELFENTADNKPTFYKKALSQMTELELDKLVTYFSTRLVKRDERFIEELCKTNNFDKILDEVMSEGRSASPHDTAVQRLIHRMIEGISEWNADYDNCGKWREQTSRQLFVDRWLNQYIPKPAWNRYQNVVRVERSTAASARDIKAIKVSKPRGLIDYDENLKSFSQEFNVSAPQARGIAMYLGAKVLTNLMLKTEDENLIMFREALNSYRDLTKDERNLADSYYRVVSQHMVNDVKHELELINETD